MKIEKFKVLLYLKKSGMDKNGKAPIMGRITVNRTMAQFSCKLSCSPSLWNPRASRLEGRSKEAVETNKDIEQLLLSIQKAFDVLVEKRTDFEAKDVKEALQGSVKTQTTLLSFVDEHISELSTHEGIDMSKSSVWTYRKIRKNLAEFIGEKYRLTDLAFGQLTEPFISDFHHYLLDEKGFSSGTITIYVSLFKKMCRIAFEDIDENFGEEYKLFLKRDQGRIDSYVNHCLLWLNMLMYKAVDRSIIRFNPIARIGYEKKAAPKMTHISKADFIRMLSTPMADERTELARRCFIFASLTSLSYIDVKKLYPHHISENSEGRKFIRKEREKTGVEFFVPLHPIAEKILSLYNTTDDSKPVFPLGEKKDIYLDVHTLGMVLGISNKLGFHASRHTFGVLMLNEDIPIGSIAKMMGHADITSTQVYAQVTEQKISNDMDKLIAKRERNKNPMA
ncbi:phage integrase SAM-like domain-containing protein [Bacteroides fragilis]|nr:phage integrase SAM-like domain-containing protein [Bacteroides fragilis]MCZ2514354.1 phage integrase SAM-like domain-containing protein [Bacteroides fragilis]